MNPIDRKWSDLRAGGFDLGAALGAESDAGYGGRFRDYTHGTIYWHPQVMQTSGALEVHGGILSRYRRMGGPGVNPATRRRDLGFPTTDEVRTADGTYPVSHFEWGAIFWSGRGGSVLRGELYRAWKLGETRLAPLLHPVTDHVPVAGGEACLFERGLLWSGPASANAVIGSVLELPMLGRPQVTTTDPGAVPLCTARPWAAAAATLHTLERQSPDLYLQLWKDRLWLRRVGRPGETREEIPLLPRRRFPPPDSVDARALYIAPLRDGLDGDGGPGMEPNIGDGDPAPPSALHVSFHLPTGVRLRERALYDVGIRHPDGSFFVLAPHAVYARSEWTQFGFVHATDLHVSRRMDEVHRRLVALGRPGSAAEYNNSNDRVRDLIAYANRLHDRGIVDAIFCTGDLVDYVYDAGDPRPGAGNFAVLERILRGGVASPAGIVSEELRVPIFTSLGNHDYRANAYRFCFDVDVAPLIKHTQYENKPHNLTRVDAAQLEGGRRPVVSRSAAIAMVAIQKELPYYFGRINSQRSYTVAMGPHRFVMLDTGWDADIIGSTWDGIQHVFGFSNENERTFAAGSPNSVGTSLAQVSRVRTALHQAGATGLVVVGMHAPPINPKGSEFPYFFRETQHPSAPRVQMQAYLVRQAGGPTTTLPSSPGEAIIIQIPDTYHREWIRTGTPHFKVGSIGNMMDFGVAVGETEALMRLCVGAEGLRAADLVLCGHGHDRVEFRLGWDATRRHFLFYTDFYTENPAGYLPSLHCTLAEIKNVSPSVVHAATVRAHVAVRSGAPMVPHPIVVRDHRDTLWATYHRIDVPPYPDPLNATSDARQWWEKHRPLIMQTAAVGPVDQNTRRDTDTNKLRPRTVFQGIRVFTVADNVIRRGHYVTMQEIRQAAGAALPWEAEYGARPAAGVPA
jgi:hypothetical protein